MSARRAGDPRANPSRPVLDDERPTRDDTIRTARVDPRGYRLLFGEVHALEGLPVEVTERQRFRGRCRHRRFRAVASRRPDRSPFRRRARRREASKLPPFAYRHGREAARPLAPSASPPTEPLTNARL